MNVKYITKDSEVGEIIDNAQGVQFIPLDTETTNLDALDPNVYLLLLQLLVRDTAYVIDARSVNLKLLSPILEDSKWIKIIQNANFDYKMLYCKAGVDVKGMYDTKLVEQLLQMGIKRTGTNLVDLTKTHCGVDISKGVRETFIDADKDVIITEDQIEYAADDVKYLKDIMGSQMRYLKKWGLIQTADLEFALIAPVAHMEIAGIKIDSVKWRKTLREIKSKIIKLSIELHNELPDPPPPPPPIKRFKKDGTPFKTNRDPKPDPILNLDSWQQIAKAFDDIGINLEKANKVTGKGLTNNGTLKFAAGMYDDKKKKKIIRNLLDYRVVKQVEKTFGENLLDHIRSDGRIHARFHQTGTDSGRFSCVPLDSEILTDEGWCTYDELNLGQSVLGYNLVTGSMEWTTVNNICLGRDKVGMLTWRRNAGHTSRPVNSYGVKCTDNHRWVAKSNNVEGFIQAKNIKSNRNHFAEFSLWKKGGFGSYNNSIEAGIIGWTVTDGHIIKLADGASLSIRVSKPTSISYLERLLKDVPHTEHTYTISGRTRYKYSRDFYVGKEVFTPIYNKLIKLGLVKYVLSLDEESAIEIYNSMMEADGSPRKTGTPFGNQRKDVIDAFSILGTMMGKGIVVNKLKDKDFMVCNVNSSNCSGKSVRYVPSNEVIDVWCPTTGLGTWIMRQDGKVVITGNSSDPNLQNIKKKGADGKILRSCFVPEDGHKFVIADYSQIELRIAAEISNDPAMLAILTNPSGDLHSETASKMYGIPMDKVDSNIRRAAKTLNFGIIYGMEVKTLSERIGCTVSEAQKHLDRYRASYSVLLEYIERAGNKAFEQGRTKTMGGRWRWFLPIDEKDPKFRKKRAYQVRVGKNHPIQGCLPRDASVLTRNGWSPIGEFTDGEVWTGERWATATKVNRGFAKRLRLHLSDGRTFDCDDRHKLLVNDSVYPRWEDVNSIIGKPLVRDVGGDWGVNVNTIDDWYWLGRMLGDGHLSNFGWGLSFGHHEHSKVEELLTWLAGKDFRGSTNSSCGYAVEYDKNNNAKVYGHTKKGKNYWESLGMVVGKGAKGKRIPSIVFSLGKLRRQAVFNGYSDADGCKAKNRRLEKITSCNRKLLEDTLCLMQTLSITGKIGKEQKNNRSVWYDLYIHKKPHLLVVESVDELIDEEMFTLSVDDERHSFSSEGLISKNTSADMTKTAIVYLFNALKPYNARVLNTVHDEVTVEVPTEHAVAVAKIVLDTMILGGQRYLKKVPVLVDCKIRDCWFMDDGADDDHTGQQLQLL